MLIKLSFVFMDAAAHRSHRFSLVVHNWRRSRCCTFSSTFSYSDGTVCCTTTTATCTCGRVTGLGAEHRAEPATRGVAVGTASFSGKQSSVIVHQRLRIGLSKYCNENVNLYDLWPVPAMVTQQILPEAQTASGPSACLCHDARHNNASATGPRYRDQTLPKQREKRYVTGKYYPQLCSNKVPPFVRSVHTAMKKTTMKDFTFGKAACSSFTTASSEDLAALCRGKAP